MNASAPASGSYVVRVRGLRLPFFIGVFDFEKAARQTVEIDVEMRVPDAVRQDGQYVSYSPVAEYAIALSRQDQHIALVETLAGMLLDKAMEDARVSEARITVLKTDIYAEADGVGVTLEARREVEGS